MTHAFSAASPSRSRRSWLHGLLTLLPRMAAIRASRQRLADLDDAMLRDIGLSRQDALTESSRPLWDVPPRWKA